MQDAWLQIELLDDCVLSQRNATAGAHRSLDYIPGSALLGVAAATLYRQLPADDALQVFHTGAVRFGNGLPKDFDGSLGWPLPLALHRYKVDAPTNAQGVLNNIVNRLFPYHGDQQLKSLREGFVTAAGRWLKPARIERLKTAIDATTGRAAESQLFGYQALRRGQRFVARVQATDAVAADVFARVVDTLCGRHLMGRSRSGEYGRVAITKAAAPAALRVRAPQSEAGIEHHYLWLLSDLAPHDALGAPTSQFDPEALGLAGVAVDFSHSFARSRAYSPWNAARHGYDQERSVLIAGSVLCLEGPAPAAGLLAEGLGLYREQGLGQVCLDPVFLATSQVTWMDQPPATQQSCAPARPVSALLDWLDARHGARTDAMAGEVDEAFQGVTKVLQQGRAQAGVVTGETFGPSPSQWGRVQEAANTARDADALFKALFAGDSAIIKRKGEGWGEEFRIDEKWQVFADWLQSQFKTWQQQENLKAQLPRFVRHLAHRLHAETGRR